MFDDAKSSLKEMATGLLYTVNAPLEWAVIEVSKWKPGEWLRMIEFVGVLAAIVVVFVEFRIEKPIDRGVRIATLFAQIADVHALPDDKGLNALRPSVEALAREGVSMSGINLSNANLSNAKLPGANLSTANLEMAELYDADLRRVDLRGANVLQANFNGANLSGALLRGALLRRADLSGANLNGADLKETILREVNLSRANLSNVQNLTQENLDLACFNGNQFPINIPKELTWRGGICLKYQ